MNPTIDLLSQMVRINSVNPDLVPGAAGEGEMARFIAEWLRERGFEVHWLEATPNRPTVVGIARGSGGGKSLLFNGHTDTVTTETMPDSLNPRIENGRMYGRGAYDMKSGLAAMMVAAKRAKALGLRGDVMVAAVADEEYGSLGSFELVQHFRADACVVIEPSELQTTLMHKGFVWFEVVVEGKAAHGSRPEWGIDAIAKMGKVLVEIEKLDLRLRANPTHPLLGSGSIHASLISGGQELSSYPARCSVWLERRLLPSEGLELAQGQLQEILDDISQSDPDFTASIRRDLHRFGHQVSESEPVVQILREQARQVLGHLPTVRGEPFWTDAAVMGGVGIPAFLFGVAGHGAHSADEWVDLKSLEQVEEILFHTAKEFCN
jgi:acetylornithine deacetylase